MMNDFVVLFLKSDKIFRKHYVVPRTTSIYYKICKGRIEMNPIQAIPRGECMIVVKSPFLDTMFARDARELSLSDFSTIVRSKEKQLFDVTPHMSKSDTDFLMWIVDDK